ncbi:SLC13 family permease [endosymbiont of Ridgeia piscesae]|jgi:di/tricarboxylate transporter|uniref:Di-and tricarboxylate transporter n=1 Tax=endosymbiont of Ridgeia piscesae TaxID=54398 RepID=A0A0T5Z3B5_9GAMM|nr:SLC13 family permease [endosymbiont of Ridgeia piscesae]KRT56037.1 Di- and tricarboxylate transporter [endosymbiont of Ridgeia piscesae]KRT57336.1 Di- and tricarboxylate transporter [endosymbiont of Ridgeia piscesae]
MGWEALFSLASVLFCFGMMAFTRVSPDLITSAALTLLLLAGVVSPEQALAGFANQGMLTVAVLYVVVSGLTETGAVGWIGQTLLGRPRSIRHAQWRLMLPVAALSAFLNNTPVVAVFIPALQEWARRHRLQLSRLLIPLSFASIAGGTCTLIGSSTNLLVNGLMLEQSGSGLALFDLLWIGLPVSLAVLLFVLLMGGWLLPNRSSAMEEFADVRAYTVEMQVEAGSPLPGRSIDEAGLRQLPRLFLAEIEREGGVLPAVSSKERLQAGDRLLFVGARDSVVDLQRIHGLLPATNQLFKLNDERPERRFIEVVVSSRHPLVGRTVREGRFRNRYNAVIIALARNGERLDGKLGDQRLQAGDTLLLEARPSFLEQQRNAQDWLLISPVGESHPLQHERAPLALGIVLLMVVLVGLGWLSMLKGALLAAGLMILTRCTRGQVARRSPDWQVLVVIATSFGIGAALQQSGAALFVAQGLMGLAGGEPWLALTLVFGITALLTALATNNVAAVLMFPIALAAAQQLQVSLLPFAITIMVAASASFATPIGYQTNLMVYNAGGYRFQDFLRIGLPLTLLVGLVTLLLVPLVWPF